LTEIVKHVVGGRTNKYCPGGYDFGAISNLITWVLNFFFECAYYLINTIRSLRQYIGRTIVYFLNRHGGSNLQDEYLGFTWQRIFKKSIRCANILAELELRGAVLPRFAYLHDNANAVTRENGKRFIRQK
jgi:hypothetical protein